MSPPDTRATKNTTGTHGRDDPQHDHHRVHRTQPTSPRHLTHTKLAPVELPHLRDMDAHARTEARPLCLDAQQVKIDIGSAECGEVSFGPVEEGVHGGAVV